MDIVERINNHLRTLAPHVAQRASAQLLRAAIAEIEKLREDAERLDWLGDVSNTIGNVQLPTHCVTANLHSLRDAIDMARHELSK